jgi:putative endonuclease
MSSQNLPKNRQAELGVLGEAIVVGWLQANGWEILHRRWHCRWGEVDIIAHQVRSQTPILAFVEVKTRSRGNWDADGLLSVTAGKQAKLGKTAASFLAASPQWEDFPCRFDVALVRCEMIRKSPATDVLEVPASVSLGQAIELGNYRLVLQDYIESAFDISY